MNVVDTVASFRWYQEFSASSAVTECFRHCQVYFQLDTPKVRLLVKTDSRFWKADTDPSKVTYSMMTWVAPRLHLEIEARFHASEQ